MTNNIFIIKLINITTYSKKYKMNHKNKILKIINI